MIQLDKDMITIYGIKNCNSMKKAFDFLTTHQIPYQFFDYKKVTLSKHEFDELLAIFGLDKVINKKGTTYKKLDEEAKNSLINHQSLVDANLAIYDIVKENQSILKRPMIIGEYNDKEIQLIGFDEPLYAKTFL